MLKKNIFANYVGMGTVAVVPIIALPWYLTALGAKLFGLISFVTLIQTVLALLDAGLSQALVREIAIRFDGTDAGRRRVAALFFGFERIYWLFAVVAGGVVLWLTDFIVFNWLNLEGLSPVWGQYAVYGAAIIFMAQFPGALYRSVLQGTQAQVPLNVILFGSTLLRHGGGVLVVFFWPSLLAYLGWFALVGLFETLVRQYFSWRTIGVKRSQTGWDSNELRPVWALVAGMSGATLLGALTVQMDKVILSRMVSIEQFGYYTIAATVALGVLQVIYPLTQAALPRATQLRNDAITLRRMYWKLYGWIGLIVAMGALTFIFFGKQLLLWWLKVPSVVSIVYPLMGLLLLGTALNALYNVGYMNWLVQKKVIRILQVNGGAFVLSIILIPLLVEHKGMIGAVFGWLIINSIGFLMSLEWVFFTYVLQRKRG